MLRTATFLRFLLPLSVAGVFPVQAEVRAENERKIPVCGYLVGKSLVPDLERIATYDKFKHCAMSCWVTLACGPIEASELGVLKEVVDLFGPGTADLRDLEADARGVRAGLSRWTAGSDGCVLACERHYPRHTPLKTEPTRIKIEVP